MINIVERVLLFLVVSTMVALGTTMAVAGVYLLTSEKLVIGTLFVLGAVQATILSVWLLKGGKP